MTGPLRALPLGVLFLVFSCGGPGGSTAGADAPDAHAPAEVVSADAVSMTDAGDVREDVGFPRDLFDFLPAPDNTQRPACQPGDGCFLDPCAANGQCQSGWCVEHLGDGVCTIPCQEECPPGWECRQVAGAEPDVVYVCVSLHANLCKPCATFEGCTSVGAADACLDYGEEGRFCGGQCAADEDCPWGFVCADAATADGVELRQCVAETGTCPCSSTAVERGLTTPCARTNEFGTCTGQRTCTADGLSACDADEPTQEVCDGLDNDCDGATDEAADVGGESVPLCDDGIDCTDDLCLGAEGCTHEALDSGECKDGDACTAGDHCEAGECVGTPVLCDDENPCTDDVCDGAGGCLFAPNTADCDDSDPCTVADRCNSGTCNGTPMSCECQTDADCAPLDDGDACTGTLLCDTATLPYQCAVDDDSVPLCPEPPAGPDFICLAAACDPANGACSLVPAHEGFACDDGDPCTLGDTCVGGVCTGGGAPNCNDGNPCTDDVCDSGTGCTHTFNQAPCNDGDACTTGDTCAQGACAGQGTLACDDGNPCTKDACQPAAGCVHAPLDQGGCDDGNACTVGDYCAGGACTGGGLLPCDDGDVCTTDACEPSAGCVHLLNQAPCDDGDVCTTGDKCSLGVCQGAGTLACDDGNICTDDSCDPEEGCVFTANGAACDDGNVCTTGDHCAGGWCGPEGVLDCDDGSACTFDVCDSEVGCLHVPQQGACDDGDACTVGDACQDGTCAPGAALVCDDSNVCTDDVCEPAQGCVFTSNIEPCDDGLACTVDDVCADGACAGTACEALGLVCWGGGCASCGTLTFDGENDFVAVEEAPGLEIAGAQNPVTLEAWLRVDAGDEALVIHKGSYPTYEYGFAVQDGYVDFRMNDGGAFLNLPIPFDDFGTWHHFAGIYDGETVTVYLDGLAQERRSHSGVVAADSYPLRMGRYGLNDGYYFTGAVGTVRVWNRALSQDELQAGMRGPVEPGAPGLVGWWTGQEGEGTVLADHSGNGYHGTISGAAWTADGPPCAAGAQCGDGILAAWEECDDGNTDPGDGCSPTCRRESVAASCKAILAQTPDATDGHYTVDPDGDGAWPRREVFCDMTTDGGGWTIGTFRPGNTRVNDAGTYRQFCTEHGFPAAGDGVEKATAWLAQKRMLWTTDHPLKKAGWPHANAYLAMPVMKKGGSAVYTIEPDGPPASLPPNLLNDHCQNADQRYCGYWYNNGWADSNLDSYPDPEDWGDAHDGPYSWFSCIFRE